MTTPTAPEAYGECAFRWCACPTPIVRFDWRAGQIVVLDHLSIHTTKRVRQAIEAKGYRSLFLPTYSPDLSPVEEAFSKLKTSLRSLEARPREALQEAVVHGLSTMTARSAAGRFSHCGYLLAA